MPYIWRSRSAAGYCSCYSSPFGAICVASMSIGLIILSIVNLSLSKRTHDFGMLLFFVSGGILISSRLYRLLPCSYRRFEPNEENGDWLLLSYQHKLAIVMKVFDIFSMMSFILYIMRSKNTSYVASVFSYIAGILFELYSVLIEMLIYHFGNELGVHDKNNDCCSWLCELHCS